MEFQYQTLPFDAERDAVVDDLASFAAALPPASREEDIRAFVVDLIRPEAHVPTSPTYHRNEAMIREAVRRAEFTKPAHVLGGLATETPASSQH